ncbi:MAG: Gfo/Idh/MocA family oxidoreductase [Rhodospirillales bacterium]|nr:Gfo/Idh/MocA family oxidoreductase [Rhodospirillales bacterium]MDP6644507.1 Gfo/Idh/MocA family oxidoreductase [Rhodospirillales bacterium]
MAEKLDEIGLAIIGCGVIARFRSQIARDFPGVNWLGLCDLREDFGRKLADDVSADYFTTDMEELVKRPEVNAVMVITDENRHFDPVRVAIEAGIKKLLIEKPLATEAGESAQILKMIQDSGADACVGYTVRFTRRFLTVKERLKKGQIGDVHSVVTRAFMNRMVPIATVRKTNQRHNLTPMVVSGTHSLDMSLWFLEGKKPVSVYAQSVDKTLSDWGTKDSTFGVFTMDDGTIFSMNISWALPEVWPGSVYGLEIGIVGSNGVIDIEDTHRDVIMASNEPIGHGYNPDGYDPGINRYVDFLESYPPGSYLDGQLWGANRDETLSWFTRITGGGQSPHASAEDGHRNLLLTMAMDLSARTGEVVNLPDDLNELIALF